MYLVMDFVQLGPIGTRKFWKVRNKKNKLPKDNRLMPTRDAKHYFRQLISGLYHSKKLNFNHVLTSTQCTFRNISLTEISNQPICLSIRKMFSKYQILVFHMNSLLMKKVVTVQIGQGHSHSNLLSISLVKYPFSFKKLIFRLNSG